MGRIEDRAARFRTAFFVAGGTRVATEDRDGEVRVWKLEHPSEPERSLGKGLYPALSRERKTLIVAHGTFPELDDARLVNTGNGAETALHPDERGFPLTVYSISADERLVAFADYRNAVLVFDVRTGRKLRRRVFAGEWKLQDVNFTPDGMLLVEGAGRGAALEIRVWDPATDSEGPVLRVPGGPAAKTVAVTSSANAERIALVRGDSTIASPGQESHLTVWERRTGRLLYDLREAQTGFVTAMQFSPTADVLATGSRNHEVRLWNASTGALLGVVGIHHGTPTRPDEETRAHIETGTVFNLSQSKGAGINTLQFSADGRSIVTASGEFAAVRVWDATVDPSAQDLPVKGDSHTAIAFSPDGRFVFTADRNGVIATWDAARRIKTAQVAGHPTAVFGLAVSPDGARLASAGTDGVLKIWRVPQLVEDARWSGAPGTTEHLVLTNDRVTHLTRRPEGTGPPPQNGTYDVQQFTVGGTPCVAAHLSLPP